MRFPKFLSNVPEVYIYTFLGETGIGKTYSTSPIIVKPSKVSFKGKRYVGSDGQFQVSSGVILFSSEVNVKKGDKILLNGINYVVESTNKIYAIHECSGIEVIINEF